MVPHPAVCEQFVRGIAWRMYHECPAFGIEIHIDGDTQEAVHAVWQSRQPEGGAVTVDDAMVLAKAVLEPNSRVGGYVISDVELRAALAAALKGQA